MAILALIPLKSVEKAVIFDPIDKREDEIFKVADDKVVNNIEDFRYLISNQGRIYDTKLEVYKNWVPNRKEEFDPYYKVKFNYNTASDSKVFSQKDVYIHRAVASTFLENDNPEEKTEVDHLDGDHKNNNLENLDWVTPGENKTRAEEKGFLPVGEDRASAKLKNAQVYEICSMIIRGDTLESIAKKYNVSAEIIYSIKKGKNYKCVSKNFKLPEVKKVRDKLSDETVHEVCKRLERGDKIVDIYTELGIERSVVNSIKKGRYYNRISKNYNIPEVTKVTILHDEQIHEICKLLEENKLSCLEIAKIYNVSDGVISNIKSGKYHSDISSQYNIPKPGSQYISEDVAKIICSLLQKGYKPDSIVNMGIATKGVVEGIYYKRSFVRISKDYNF